MANFGSAFGFVPVDTTDGSDYHGKMREVTIDDTLVSFPGDFMSLSTNVAADEVLRVDTSVSTEAFAALVGSLDEIFPDFTDEGTLISNFAPASGGDRSGRIVVGNEVIYQVREDAVGDAFDGSDIGLAADLVNGGGSTITGISGMALDSSVAPASTGQFILRRLGKQQGNVFAVSGGVGAIWNVTINPDATA